MNWNKSCLLNIPHIDAQHKQLFALISNIQARDTISKEDFLDIVGFLVKYAYTHFYDEEVLMVKSNYHGYSNHKRIHDSFKTEIDELLESFNDLPVEIPKMYLFKLTSKINDWLYNHIMRADKDFGLYLKSYH